MLRDTSVSVWSARSSFLLCSACIRPLTKTLFTVNQFSSIVNYECVWRWNGWAEVVGIGRLAPLQLLTQVPGFSFSSHIFPCSPPCWRKEEWSDIRGSVTYFVNFACLFFFVTLMWFFFTIIETMFKGHNAGNPSACTTTAQKQKLLYISSISIL